MTVNHQILELDNVLYRHTGRELSIVEDTHSMIGDIRVVTDYDGATPQVARVDAEPRFAPAMIEKRLRENGEIEVGGRVVVLGSHRRGRQSSEVLFLPVTEKTAAERHLEHSQEQGNCLFFPLHLALVDRLRRLSPAKPAALLLVNQRHVDVLVADQRRYYSAFRVSAFRAGDAAEVMATSLRRELDEIEREHGIRVGRMHVLQLLVADKTSLDWIESLAASRGSSCRFERASKVRVERTAHRSSELKTLWSAPATSSSSSIDAVINHRVGRMLPYAAAVLLAAWVASATMLVKSQVQAGRIATEVAELQRTINASVDGTRINAPGFREYVDLAGELYHAGRIPEVADVLSHVSGATRSQHTEIGEIDIDYDSDGVRLRLAGTTAKGSDSDSMTRYNRFIALMRRHGYTLDASDIHTGTRDIRFELVLSRPLGGAST